MIVLMIAGEAKTTCGACGTVWHAGGADAEGRPVLTKIG